MMVLSKTAIAASVAAIFILMVASCPVAEGAVDEKEMTISVGPNIYEGEFKPSFTGDIRTYNFGGGKILVYDEEGYSEYTKWLDGEGILPKTLNAVTAGSTYHIVLLANYVGDKYSTQVQIVNDGNNTFVTLRDVRVVDYVFEYYCDKGDTISLSTVCSDDRVSVTFSNSYDEAHIVSEGSMVAGLTGQYILKIDTGYDIYGTPLPPSETTISIKIDGVRSDSGYLVYAGLFVVLAALAVIAMICFERKGRI